MPTDCYPFTITATSQRESMTITNDACFTPDYVATRPADIICNCPSNGCMNIQGLGATGKTYQTVASPSVNDPVWTPVSTSIADGNGRFFIPAQSMTGFPMRFFRTVTQ
jgi:hypothetical protein